MKMNVSRLMRPFVRSLMLALALGAAAASAAAQDHTGHTSHGQATGMPYDLHYIDMTVMHHEQGVEMARLAEQKGQSAQVKAFAKKSAADQERDTKELQRYRDTWYPGRPQMDHSQMTAHMQSMPGQKGMRMDHGADIEKLRAASGAAFDRLFLDTMIHHHQMALDMSKEAAAKAEHAELKTFARRVLAKQQAEVAEMKRLKAGAGGASARKAAAKPAPRRTAKPKRPAPKSTNHSGHSGHNMH
jgi:uncharacterized protein (DUF305 family)